MSALSLACIFSARIFVWRVWRRTSLLAMLMLWRNLVEVVNARRYLETPLKKLAKRAQVFHERGTCGHTLSGFWGRFGQKWCWCWTFEVKEEHVLQGVWVSLSSASWHWRTCYQDQVKASFIVSRKSWQHSKITEKSLLQLCPFLLAMTLMCPPCSVQVNICLPKKTFGLPKEKRTCPGSRIQECSTVGRPVLHTQHAF